MRIIAECKGSGSVNMVLREVLGVRLRVEE